jgi:hypothetical protein
MLDPGGRFPRGHDVSSTLHDEVWLIKSRTNPFPVQGEMDLSDGRVTVTVTGGKDCTAGMREHLEEQAGVPGLADRLATGEAIQVLEFDPAAAEASFPVTAGGYIAKVEVGDKTWYIALAYPAGGGIQNVLSMKKGRKLAKVWKDALGAK